MGQTETNCPIQGASPDETMRITRCTAVLLLMLGSAPVPVPAGPLGAVEGVVVKSGPEGGGGTPPVAVAPSEDAALPGGVTGKDGAPMLLIPAGEFVMGSPEGEGLSDERPQHRVRIDAFYLDTYEVTIARFEKFLDATGHVRPDFWPYEETLQYAERPVVGVAWSSGQAYCEWAGKRLPTEAEWEYAARGKDGRRYPWGSAEPGARSANVAKSWSHNFYKDRLEPVGSHGDTTSPFGVHDMAGNVWEWVADWYDAKYYARSPERNPPGPRDGSMRVLRGGSWNFAGQYSRTTSRLRYEPRHRAADIGFRCARDVHAPR